MIQITIPDAELKNATVFQAVTTLVAALGPRRPGRPRGSGVKPPAAAPARRGRPRMSAGAAPRVKRAYTRRPATARAAKPAAAPQARGEKPSPEAWAKFVDALRPRQRKFLSLVEARKILFASDAMKELGVPSSSLGGIVGALLRWAPARGIELPFSARKTDAGEKTWVWEG